jgi:hypothetical protein
MSKPAFLWGYTKSKLIALALLLLIALSIFFLGPRWLKGAAFLTLGIAGIISLILVKKGIKKPEILRPFRTHIGYLLLSIGFLGYGLDNVFTDMGWYPDADSALYWPLGAVMVLMALCLFVGLLIEWRAFMKRKGKAEQDV